MIAWLTPDLVIAIHSRALHLFGGAHGVRDKGLLESALARPQNKYHYGDDRHASLAAAYAYGIARNHPFVDGNKRTALLCIVTVLGLNDIAFTATEAEAVVMMRGLASGEVNEEMLANWIADNMQPA